MLADSATATLPALAVDVGCGTGILCMFPAKAGAKHVYGVSSDRLALSQSHFKLCLALWVECAGSINQARIIVKDNGFSDGTTQPVE